MRKFIQATIFLVATIMASSAFADIKVAVVYDMGGKFDKSFNEGVYNGAKRFSDETGIRLGTVHKTLNKVMDIIRFEVGEDVADYFNKDYDLL